MGKYEISLVERMRRSKKVQVLGLLSPSAIYLLVFFLLPLVIVLLVSLGKRGPMGTVVYDWNLGNYARFIDPIYVKIFIRSVWIATANTVLCLVFGYPAA